MLYYPADQQAVGVGCSSGGRGQMLLSFSRENINRVILLTKIRMILLVLILASVCDTSAITQSTEDKEVSRGSPATIPCDLLTGANGSNIIIQKIAWYKGRNIHPIYG